MRKIFALLLAVAFVVGIAPYARSLGTPSAPPAVAVKDWIPLGDAAGFVISHDTNNPMPGAAREKPGTVMGYFMVRRSSAWLRVDSAPGYNVQQTLALQ